MKATKVTFINNPTINVDDSVWMPILESTVIPGTPGSDICPMSKLQPS